MPALGGDDRGSAMLDATRPDGQLASAAMPEAGQKSPGKGESAHAPLQSRADAGHDLRIETGARHHDEGPLAHSAGPDRRDRARRKEQGKSLGSAWQPDRKSV